MKVDKKVYKYIDYELQHYQDNKNKIKELRDEIINSSPEPSDGQPRGNSVGFPTESKALKLISSTILYRIEINQKAIDKVYNQLNEDYKKFFELNYINNEGIVKTCLQANISERTYYNMRDKIIISVGMELGLI